jgi:hypothetical protein
MDSASQNTYISKRVLAAYQQERQKKQHEKIEQAQSQSVAQVSFTEENQHNQPQQNLNAAFGARNQFNQNSEENKTENIPSFFSFAQN